MKHNISYQILIASYVRAKYLRPEAAPPPPSSSSPTSPSPLPQVPLETLLDEFNEKVHINNPLRIDLLCLSTDIGAKLAAVREKWIKKNRENSEKKNETLKSESD